MGGINHLADGRSSMDATFPPFEGQDLTTEVVVFPADLADGRRLECRISYEALADNFGAKGHDDMLRAFNAERTTIEAKALALIRQGRVDELGRVTILSGDGR